MPIYACNFSNKNTRIGQLDTILIGVGSALPQNNRIQILAMAE
jgi:hypothetical protein